ncbi:MAG: biotin/lipoyl-binding protein, partial [Desulfobacterales bacterium]|nr:biotin/lipoyl-binding protein [Desulfobacterales bacterium]
VRGQVVDVPVKEGEMVKKGQVIARIDSRDYRNALDSVLADYDRAKKNLARMEQLYREEIIPRDRY